MFAREKQALEGNNVLATLVRQNGDNEVTVELLDHISTLLLVRNRTGYVCRYLHCL